MIESISIENAGMLKNFNYANPTGINLIIGESGIGKTFLLKLLYSAIRTMEEYHRGDDIRTVSEILSEKIRWLFQTDKLGELVTRGESGALSLAITYDSKPFKYTFTQSASSKVGAVTSPAPELSSNSIFIPAKEVLSLYSVIQKSRDLERSFGFDDTYYELTKALAAPLKRGQNISTFSKSRKKLAKLIKGKVDLDQETGKWYYKSDNKCKFSIGSTSEGIKKIAIFDRLLGNGFLNSQSTIFIDEPESALHPQAVCDFLDIIFDIALNMKIQFFIASQSYFVIKKLLVLAVKKPKFITCISLNREDGKYPIAGFYDLHKGMPDNIIIDTVVHLYDSEIKELIGGNN